MALILLDGYTDTDLTQLNAHTPDVPGSGSYTTSVDATTMVIKDRGGGLSILNLDSTGSGTPLSVITVNGPITFINDGEWYVDFSDVVSFSPAASGSIFQMHARVLNTTTDIDDIESLFLQVAANAGTVQVVTGRYDGLGAIQENMQHTTDFGWPAVGVARRMGMTLAGDPPLIRPWWEPYGGGTRTLIGSDNTNLTLGLANSSHLRYALMIRGGTALTIDVDLDLMAFLNLNIKNPIVSQSALSTFHTAKGGIGRP